MLKKLPWKAKKIEKIELTLWEVEEYTNRNATDVKYLYVFMTFLVIHSFAPFLAFTMFHRDIPVDGSNYPEVCAVACSIPFVTKANQTASCPSGSEYIFNTKGIQFEGEIKINVSSPCIQDCFRLADDDAFLNFCSDKTGESVRKLVSKLKMDDQLMIVKLFYRNFTFSLIFRLVGLAFIYMCFILLYYNIKKFVPSSVVLYIILNLVVTVLILACLVIFFNLIPEISLKGILKVESICRIVPASLLFCSLVYTVWMLTWARKLMALAAVMFKMVHQPIASLSCLLALNGIAMLFAGIVISLVHILIVSYYSCGVLVVADGQFHYRKSSVLLVLGGFQVVFAWWILFFMKDLLVAVVAGSVSNWYFTKPEVFETCSRLSPVTASLSVICKYHLGSIVAGSFFHAFDYFRVALVGAFFFTRSKRCLNKNSGKCLGYVYSATGYAPYVITVVAGLPFFEAVEKCHELMSGVSHLRKSLVPFFFVYNTLIVSTYVGVSMLFLHKVRGLEFFYPMIVFLTFTSFLVVRLISAFFTAVLLSTLVSFLVEQENGDNIKGPMPFIEMGKAIADRPYGYCAKNTNPP
ncbi:choline transporter-like protein 1 isoform X2 [Cimex lectularius]|uniref:Choline transporter-like protein n=1 Tax=Cimex lectularius TaxID=79782 RepID=A0A8I6TE94_CIMLE|nr:choline transporter-like protein 1 isoform X2 [Cimex lectularius]